MCSTACKHSPSKQHDVGKNLREQVVKLTRESFSLRNFPLYNQLCARTGKPKRANQICVENVNIAYCGWDGRGVECIFAQTIVTGSE